MLTIGFDSSVTPEEAARLRRDLGRRMKTLRRLDKALRERETGSPS